MNKVERGSISEIIDLYSTSSSQDEAHGGSPTSTPLQNGTGNREADISLRALMSRSQKLESVLAGEQLLEPRPPTPGKSIMGVYKEAQNRNVERDPPAVALNRQVKFAAPATTAGDPSRTPNIPRLKPIARSPARSTAASKTKSLVQKFYSRPVNTTLGVPGTGTFTNRPVREDVPILSHSGDDQQPNVDPTVKEARDLLRITQSLLGSMNQLGTEVWKRPAPTTARKVVTAAVPWFKPEPLRDVTTFQASKTSWLKPKILRKAKEFVKSNDGEIVTGTAHATSLVSASNATEVGKHTADLLAQADALGKKCNDAVKTLELADEFRLASRQQLAALERGAMDGAGYTSQGSVQAVDSAVNGPRSRRGALAEHIDVAGGLGRDSNSHADKLKLATEAVARAEARYRAAESTLLEASRSLNGLIHGTDLLQLSGLHLLAKESDKLLDFSSQRLQDIKTQVVEIRTDAHDRRKTIELELKTRDEEQNTLRLLINNRGYANEAVNKFKKELDELQSQLPPAGSDRSTSEPRLLDKIKDKQRALEDAVVKHKACSEKVEKALTAITEIRTSIDDLLHNKSVQVDRLEAADKAAALLEHAELGAPQKAVASKGKAADPESLLERIRDRFVEIQAKTTPAFPQTSPELHTALAALASRATSSSPEAPAPYTVLQIATDVLADVTGKDAGRATRVLKTMQKHPVTHWLETGTGPTSSAAADARTLCRKLATLPGGAEIIQMISNSEPLAPTQLEALDTFWKADTAAQAETNPEVSSWLEKARDVAAATVAADPKADDVRGRFDDVDHAAFNAVRNGYLSNAPGTPYDQHNQRLSKALNEWVTRQAPKSEVDKTAPTGGTRNRMRKLLPNVNKTPYKSEGLKKAYDVSESMGMVSPRREVDRAVQKRMEGLERILEESAKHSKGSPEEVATLAASKALIEHLKKVNKPGTHLAEFKLGSSDAGSIRKRMQGKALPYFFTKICSEGSTAYDALDRVDKRLHQLMPNLPPLNDEEENSESNSNIADSVRLLKQQHFATKEDVFSFFRPYISGMERRDRLRIGNGGTVGPNLPYLLFGYIIPFVSPLFSTDYAHTNEAVAQLAWQMPTGIEMSFGRTSRDALEVSGGAAAGPDFGVARLQGTEVTTLATSKTTGKSTLMRFFDEYPKDDEMRANMLNALDSMVRWDQIKPENGRKFDSPLEAIFARNPAISISQEDTVTTVKRGTERVSFRSPFLKFDLPHLPAAATFNAEPFASADATRTYLTNVEHGGQVQINGDRSDAAEQRIRVGFELDAAPISGQIMTHGAGPSARQAFPLQLSATRDLSWSLDRHFFAPFTQRGKQHRLTETNRFYATPADMLAEIQQNRDQWLMTCIEGLEPDQHGKKDNPDNRIRASILLENFENTVKEAAASSKYCEYNLVSTLRPQAATSIDGYRALEQIARQRGDTAGVQKSQQAIESILQMPGTWCRDVLVVIERAQESPTRGLRYFARWQRVSNINSRRTVAQFPPPS